jgi:uncharacterized protein YeaO (DUF488 family)
MMIKLKRVYEKIEENDGYRILVDRLWPRGVSKSEAGINEWLKDVAPSDQLRKWYSHDVTKWADFKQRYFAELATKVDLLRPIMEKASTKSVTLIYAAKDVEHNNAVALKKYIEGFNGTDEKKERDHKGSEAISR